MVIPRRALFDCLRRPINLLGRIVRFCFSLPYRIVLRVTALRHLRVVFISRRLVILYLLLELFARAGFPFTTAPALVFFIFCWGCAFGHFPFAAVPIGFPGPSFPHPLSTFDLGRYVGFFYVVI